MISELSFTAIDYLNFVEYTLSIYNKTTANVVAITADNAQVNNHFKL